MEIATSQEFKDRLGSTQQPVLVYFSASWCGPCRSYRPRVEQVSNTWSDRALFLAIDVDDSPELVETYGIKSVPTIICINTAENYPRLVGPKSLDDLDTFIKGVVE
jgi:thioredoxin-like negative regulator of GroEL